MFRIYSDLDITRICVMLGDACDFSCRHCIMTDVHTGIKKTISEDLIKYLQRMCDIHPRIENTRSNLVKISFWGGEPLLYFPLIKEIVERVNRPDAEYSIVTNGFKLNEKHVDFFNSLNRGVVFLSNDGPQTARIRDFNMLESKDFCDTFNALNMRGIDTVIHAFNQDYYALWDYIDEKCGNIPIAHEFLEVNWGMPKDIYQYRPDEYRASLRKAAENLRKNLLNGIVDCREFELFERDITVVRRTIEKQENLPINEIYPACAPYRYSAHIDLQGNMYVCHSGFGKLGHVSEGFQAIYDKCQLALETSELARKKPCEQCLALPICRKGCPYVLGDLPGQKECCDIQKIYADEVFRLIKSFATTETELEL